MRTLSSLSQSAAKRKRRSGRPAPSVAGGCRPSMVRSTHGRHVATKYACSTSGSLRSTASWDPLARADRRVFLLSTIPGIGPVFGLTIAADTAR
jgi:hypothetical protein